MPRQFVVPQFIDVESKIFGPITMRQFVSILVAGFVEFVIYKLSDFVLFALMSVFVAILTFVFAFKKVQGLPFHFFLLNYVQRFKKPTVRVWDKSGDDAGISLQLKKEKEEPIIEDIRKSQVSGSHLAELSLIVDTGGVYKGENVLGKLNKKR